MCLWVYSSFAMFFKCFFLYKYRRTHPLITSIFHFCTNETFLINFTPKDPGATHTSDMKEFILAEPARINSFILGFIKLSWLILSPNFLGGTRKWSVSYHKKIICETFRVVKVVFTSSKSADEFIRKKQLNKPIIYLLAVFICIGIGF